MPTLERVFRCWECGEPVENPGVLKSEPVPGRCVCGRRMVIQLPSALDRLRLCRGGIPARDGDDL